MGKIKNKLKGVFSGRSKTPDPHPTQQPPPLLASAVGQSSNSLQVPSTCSLPQTTVATTPLVGDAHSGPHGVSSSSHSTLQHHGTNSSSSTKVDNRNPPTSSWSNLVAPRFAPLNPLAGDEIFREQLSKCQDTLTEAQRNAFLGASANRILDMMADLNNEHKHGSITRKYATKVKGFLQVADNYLHALAIIVQHSPDYSSLVIGGLRFFIDIGKRYTDFFDKLEAAMEKWIYYLEYLSRYAELYSHYDEVKRALCVAYGDLIEFFKCVCGLFMGEKGELNNKTSSTLLGQQLIRPLEDNITAIMMNLNEHIAFMEKITDILEKKRQLLKEEAQQRRDILAWLSKLEPEEDLERIYTKRHDGTGTWFFNSPEVKQWYQEDKKCLLWCYGTAGVGKSVLASALLKDIISKHQDNPSIGICFFFFNFQATDTQKPCHLFSLLLKQLCRTQKAIPQGLQAFYTKYYSNDKSPTLLELQHQFVAVSSFFEQVFLVIDAFDECNQDDRKEILNGITRLLQNCSTKLKLCVTSRPEKDIKHAFTSSGFSTIKIEATKVDQDISSFVQHQLQVRTHEHCTLNDEICKEIEHALLLKANGMFLWVKCLVDEIFEQPSIADIRVALQSLPSDIDATYRQIVGKILKQTRAMRALAEWALTWVITAKRPLSPVELAQAVATNPDKPVSLDEIKTKYMPHTVVDSCYGLIAVEQDIVRPIHYTVQEFLVREWPWGNTWDPVNAHAQIAQSCLRYLSSFDDTKLNFLVDNCDNTSERLTFTGRLFDYIATSWPYHVRSCSAKIPSTSTLKELLQNLLSDTSSADTLLHLLYLWCRGEDLRLIPYISIPAIRYCAVVDLHPVYTQLFPNNLSQEESRKFVSLSDAARTGSIQLVRDLLDLIGDVNTPDADGCYILHGGIASNKPEMVKYLLAQGARIDVVSQGTTPIAQSAKCGSVKIAQLLIQEGASLTVPEGERPTGSDYRYKDSPLHVAAAYGQEAMVKFLLDQGLDVNMQHWYFGTVLQAAAYGGDETIVTLLMEHGAEVNAQGGNYGCPLQAAAHRAKHDTTNIVQYLLDAGSDVHLVGGKYGTALQAAASRGKESVVRLLLDAGAEVNVIGGKYGTALQAAAMRGKESVVKMLLDAGAEVNIISGKCGTALQASATHCEEYGKDLEAVDFEEYLGGEEEKVIMEQAAGSREPVVKLLLDAGAEVNIVSGEYGTALHAAAWGGDESVVKMLLDAGAEVSNICGKYGTALQACASVDSYREYDEQPTGSRESIAKLLLGAGAEVNIVGGEYGTALQAAAYNGHESVIKLLLEAGAAVNIVGGIYGTALHAAACSIRSNLQVLLMLLNAGADVHVTAGMYGTVLQAAAACPLGDRVGKMKLLLERGVEVNIRGGEYGTALNTVELFFVTLVEDSNSRNRDYWDLRDDLERAIEFLKDNGAEAGAWRV